MKSCKGQALVEFVMIIPIVLILVFCIIDFSRVISTKSTLDNITTDIITFYENGSSKEEIEKIVNKDSSYNIKVNISKTNGYTKINTTTSIKPITPGLNRINLDIFNISVDRMIKDEETIE